jgi:choline dehydrogenase-like flavoprotein
MPPTLDLAAQGHNETVSADVAIIGAGPVGLMIANYLGLQGVRVVLVEKLDQIIDYPRAIGLDDEALRVFQSVGLAEVLLRHTTPDHWMRFVTHTGHCFASIEPRTDEFGWSRRNAFIQPLADRVLYEGLRRFPHVDVRHGIHAGCHGRHDRNGRPEGRAPHDSRIVYGWRGWRQQLRATSAQRAVRRADQAESMDRCRCAQRSDRLAARLHALRSEAPICVGGTAAWHPSLRIHGDAWRD